MATGNIVLQSSDARRASLQLSDTATGDVIVHTPTISGTMALEEHTLNNKGSSHLDGNLTIYTAETNDALSIIASTAQPRSGILLKSLNGSSAVDAAQYINFYNEHDIKVASIDCLNTKDGSATFAFSTTPTGVRDATRLRSHFIVHSHGTIGYWGGGIVVQPTNKSTAVTLNKPCGRITLANSPLVAGQAAAFAFNNTYIGPSDILLVCLNDSTGGYGGNYNAWVSYVGDNGAWISIRNVSNGTLSDTISVHFFVLKG